ncbi:MAG TPA: apolipoprotein N-acyltransferase [bacterium]|nr:apolipoprotein N-acyltransferase [bacterium]HPN45468.1 apolipoprotein N-acyltransferase [bacterium]
MFKSLQSHIRYMLAGLSGVMTGLAFYGSPFSWLEWLALVPLFFAINNTKPGKALATGLLTGLSTGLVFFLWVFPVASRFMGRASILSFIFYLTLSLFYAALPACFSFLFTWYKKVLSDNFIILQHIFVAGGLWIGLEWLHCLVFTGIPCTLLYPVYSQCPIPALLQPAAVTGGAGISFIIVAFNYLIFIALLRKKAWYVVTGGIIFALLTGYGVICMKMWHDRPAGTPVKVCILQENIVAEARWNDATADSLANIFISLNRQAAAMKPDLILWSETAIPWTFRPDDDLLNAALQISAPGGARHVLGMLTAATDNAENVYNSAYYIEPDGRVTGITHKVQMLSFVEKPLLDWSILSKLRMPVYRMGLQKNLLAGKRRSLLRTAFGQAGVIICNETLTGEPARDVCGQGATFLLAMSNDAWFLDRNIPRFHFDYTVLRAIENRRDIAVSSNGGFAGFIDASGKVVHRRQSREPQCIYGTIQPRYKLTFYTRYGDVLVYMCLTALFGYYIYCGILKRRQV